MINYFKDVRSEMRHVSWPSRLMVVVYTIVVLGVSLATAIYLGLWDYLFAAILRRVI
jgi:preprotein translocase subunit SecE